MFFKELLHVCILFSYQCSLVLLITHSRQLLYNIMCCFLCQQLFSTFFNSFSLFQRRPLKLAVFSCLLLPCSATLVNIHLPSTKVNNILQNIFKRASRPIRTIFLSFFVHYAQHETSTKNTPE